MPTEPNAELLAKLASAASDDISGPNISGFKAVVLALLAVAAAIRELGMREKRDGR